MTIAVPFDERIQRSVGGYPKGAVVTFARQVWRSVIDDNMRRPDDATAWKWIGSAR